jgi:hypothetical protein
MCANWILFAYLGVVCMQLLESMLTKLVDEFENRLTTQNDLVCLVSFAHCLSLCFCNPSALLHRDIWQYVVLALGNYYNQNQSIGTGESSSEKYYGQH